MAQSAVPASTEKPLRVGMVQSNIVDYERLRREMGAYEVVRHVLDTHYAMSREAVEQHRREVGSRDEVAKGRVLQEQGVLVERLDERAGAAVRLVLVPAKLRAADQLAHRADY